MSMRFEWTMSCLLRPDTPAAFLAEFRFHLGLTETMPTTRQLPYSHPVFVVSQRDGLPGGRVTSLREAPPPSTSGRRYGMFARTMVADDAMADYLAVVPPWLARWSLTQGWIGYAREDRDLQPWLQFYAMDGHAYAAQPGEDPAPLGAGAPPFSLQHTINP